MVMVVVNVMTDVLYWWCWLYHVASGGTPNGGGDGSIVSGGGVDAVIMMVGMVPILVMVLQETVCVKNGCVAWEGGLELEWSINTTFIIFISVYFSWL